MRTALVLACLIAMSAARTAQGQNPERLRATIDLGIQLNSQVVRQGFTATLNQEAASIAHEIDVSGGRVVDAGAAYRLAGPLWAVVAVSALFRTTEGTLSAEVPHPFYFQQPRLVEGTVKGLQSSEKAVHVSVAYRRPVADRLDVAIFGGPSRFSLSQDLVTDITHEETYPFDTATFASASTARASGSAWGFNVGADVTWRLSRMFGVGGLIRFTKASAALRTGVGNDVSLDVGGPGASGGLRMIF